MAATAESPAKMAATPESPATSEPCHAMAINKISPIVIFWGGGGGGAIVSKLLQMRSLGLDS